MTGKEWYAEQCRKPEWQKKRLEVLELAGWKCEMCWQTEKTLSVHHHYYKSGAKPWEYPNRAYMAVCESCHKLLHRKNFAGIAMDALFRVFSYDLVAQLVDIVADLPEGTDYSLAFTGREIGNIITWLSAELAQEAANRIVKDGEI